MNVHHSAPTYSLIIPIFNEEQVLPLLFDRLGPVLDRLRGSSEVIFVNDGSVDRSPTILMERARNDPRLRVINLSRNFGHQIAITAGMAAARGDAAVILDADLQDPPELIDTMIERWREGHDVVYATRTDREGETAFKRTTARVSIVCSIGQPTSRSPRIPEISGWSAAGRAKPFCACPNAIALSAACSPGSDFANARCPILVRPVPRARRNIRPER